MGNSTARQPKLSPKQARFVDEYLVDDNGTQAAIRAGYAPASAHVTASQLLRLPKVAAALESVRKEQQGRTQVTADRILQELARVAFSDITKVFRADGSMLPPNEWPHEAKAALAGVETEELFDGKGDERVQVGVSRKVKHWDKVKAIELLMRHNGMLRDKVELTGKDGDALNISIDLGAGR